MEELICGLHKEKSKKMSEKDIIEGFKALYQTDEVERISNDPIYLIKISPENDLWGIVEGKEQNLWRNLKSVFDKRALDEKASFIRESQKPPEKNKNFFIEKLGGGEEPQESPDDSPDAPDAQESWEKKQIKYDFGRVLINLPGPSQRIPIGVATIDTGINPDHHAFGGVLWRAKEDFEILVRNELLNFPTDSFGFDTFNADNQGLRGLPFDTDNHGTAVAGIIGAEEIGIARFNEGNFPIQLLAVKAFSSQDNLESTATIIMALDFITEARKVLLAAETLDLRVVNMSFGYLRRDNENFSSILEEKIKGMADDDGIIFIGASGNNGTDVDGGDFGLDWKYYPAGIDSVGVISVAASNSEGFLWDSSNFGTESVHIAAPGDRVLTTQLEGGYSLFSGTSLAAPFVSASAALLLLTAPQLINGTVKDILLDNANTNPPLKVSSEGRLNISDSISNI